VVVRVGAPRAALEYFRIPPERGGQDDAQRNGKVLSQGIWQPQSGISVSQPMRQHPFTTPIPLSVAEAHYPLEEPQTTIGSVRGLGPKMKRLLLGTVFGMGLISAPALGADMSYPVKAQPIIVPVFSWTGFYLGGNVGYGGNKFRYPFSAFADEYECGNQVCVFAESDDIAIPPGYVLDDSLDLKGAFDLTSSGFFGGGQIGYNYQFENSWVIGVEADFEWSGIEGELNGNANLLENGDLLGGLNFSAGSEIEWFGTIRARLGYAWDRVFLYGTGGAAYGKVKSHGSLSVFDDDEQLFGGSVSKSDTQWGWTVGAGLEYAITDHWTFKTEYLYVDLGSQTLFKDQTGFYDELDYIVVGAQIDVETKFHTIKAGLNYKW
jgi:outer membrane immunogenic protein